MNPGVEVRLAARWLERALFAMGGVLALWCVFSVGRASYYARLPVPPPSGVLQLPGDAPATPPAAVAPERRAWIARLDAPSVTLSATVLEGSDDGTLARAAGHIEDTAFPGQPGNIGIAGHRDTIFRPLRHLRPGDPLILSTKDRVFRYRVSRTQIVDPKDVYVLDPTDQPVVTLVTCYPFDFVGHAPRRFIVRAELVGETARLEAGGPGIPGR
jgi:LPXTG-site transpeptidase (sortase) family protein